MKKIFIFILVVLMFLFGLFALYSWKKGGELLFDMEKVNGVSNNNPYEIRNNVYTYMKKVLENPEIPELKEETVRNLFLNFAKADLVGIKYFSNKSRSIEIILRTSTIMDCINKVSEEKSKNHKIYDYFSKEIIGFGQYNRKSNFEKELELTSPEEIQIIQKILDHYVGGITLNPRERSPTYYPELCDKYMNKVLDENEFWE